MMLQDSVRVCGVKPNTVTFNGLFSACCHADLIEGGLHLFNNMKTKLVVELKKHIMVVSLIFLAGPGTEKKHMIL